jgi:hypothetical protein
MGSHPVGTCSRLHSIYPSVQEEHEQAVRHFRDNCHCHQSSVSLLNGRYYNRSGVQETQTFVKSLCTRDSCSTMKYRSWRRLNRTPNFPEVSSVIIRIAQLQAEWCAVYATDTLHWGIDPGRRLNSTPNFTTVQLQSRPSQSRTVSYIALIDVVRSEGSHLASFIK